MKIGIRKPSLKKRVIARTSPKRIVRSKIKAPKGAGFLTNPKKATSNRVYNRTTKKACYIATTVYGNPDAWQVEKLRQYRDDVLMEYYIGRIFIRIYYFISPYFINIFKNVRPLNYAFRKLLDTVVNKIK